MSIKKVPNVDSTNPFDTVESQTVVLLDAVTGLPVSSENPLSVSLVGGNVTLTGPITVANSVEITNDEGNAIPVSGPVTDSQLRATPLIISAQIRICLGTQMITGLSSVTSASLIIPSGAVVAEIQADGGTIRVRRDGDVGPPTATRGWRLDDGTSVTVDSTLANVRLLAQSGTTTNVQIAYFDKV